LTQKKIRQRLKYIILDLFSVLFAWALFFVFRRLEIESTFIHQIQIFSPIYNFEKILLGIPLYWLFVFWLSGYYNQPLRKSRVEELWQTFVSVLSGCLGLFFILLLNDPVVNYTDYYRSFIVLFLIYFVVIYLARYTLTRIVTYNIHHRVWGFNTLIVGCGEKAMNLYQEFQNMKNSTGEIVRGFVSIDSEPSHVPAALILGSERDLDTIIDEYKIEEVIVATDSDEMKDFYEVVNRLVGKDVELKIIPKLYDFLVGGVRVTSIYGALLVDLFDVRLSESGKNVKRLMDITVSAVAIVILSPLLLLVSLLVKITSEGPVIYKQERVGLKGKLFNIYKFRTMEHNSEGDVPQLSSVNDKRITKVGHVLRKYRIDEIPQFFNVLKGDMSLVGPRPERPYYERQIIEKVPYFKVIHKVRPGITSWGMVMYGYADTVDKMIERLKYDIIYLENISVTVDVKILIYTIRTVLTGKGI
jgi:exopolysaccharide biosynthesis polyprenyl glycosylphosphotransferase